MYVDAGINLGFLSWGGTCTVLYFLGEKLDCFFLFCFYTLGWGGGGGG